MSSQKVADLLQRNKKYAETYKPVPSLKQLIAKRGQTGGVSGVAIISCSDPRVIPQQYLNFGIGEAAVIQNAGARVKDALRSLIVLDSLGKMGTIMVIHHTDCGLTHIHDSQVRHTVETRHPQLVGRAAEMEFGEIIDADQALKDDVIFLRDAFKGNIDVLGYMLDLETGLAKEVEV